MSPVLQHKISLARALYYNPDVIITEEVFENLPLALVERMLKKIEEFMPHTVLVISTTLLTLVRPKDQVIIFENGTATEHSLYEYMLLRPSSALHDIKVSNSAKRFSPPPKSERIPRLVGKPMKTSSLHGNRNDDQVVPHAALTRSKGVSLVYYWALIRKGIPVLFLVLSNLQYYLVFAAAIGQGVSVFSIWWIGSAEIHIPNMTSQKVIGIYVALVLGYAILLLSSSWIVVCLSLAATENLSQDSFKTLENVDIRWLDTQSKIMLVAYLVIVRKL